MPNTIVASHIPQLDPSLETALLGVTEAAARACVPWIGRGQEKDADQAAVNAMRTTLATLPFATRIAIGEGERDQAPMLFAGEVIGQGPPHFDLAVDPLEGTTIAAQAASGALSVLAATPSAGLLHAPDLYMEKIAWGRDLPADLLSLDASVAENLQRLAEIRGRPISQLSLCTLNRPRHHQLISQTYAAGARVVLIPDGDIAAAIATALPESTIDLYWGVGGAPEGVLAAAGLRCLGGQFSGRLLPRTPQEYERLNATGITDASIIYHRDDLVAPAALFIATGVTDGPLLAGVRQRGNQVTTQSLILNADSQSQRWVTTTHPLSGLSGLR